MPQDILPADTPWHAEGDDRPVDVKELPPAATLVRVLGVDYVHVRTDDGGDLYLTRHGLPFLAQLKPEQWYEPEWFEKHRRKLEGTSAVYKSPTREVNGRAIDLVVKYSRVGQDVPIATNIIYQVLNADFNSPFEEFSLVEELRTSEYGPHEVRILPKLPLAIYVPPEKMQLWQTGRSEQKIASKIARHPGIEIDILRDYIMLYAWIYGIDAVEAFEEGRMTQLELEELTRRVNEEMAGKGFRVLDMKPKHIIVFPEGEKGLARVDGKVRYRVVDFELLQRTSEHDQIIKQKRRNEYLVRQRDRFGEKKGKFPSHLKPVKLLGVDYVAGNAESTGGALWVVGKDSGLFDFFLPERWRKTAQIKLSPDSQIYYTRTKDNIHLVWRVSRVGEGPDPDTDAEKYERLQQHGFNSPFEEFSIAMLLRERGVPTIYPRAIYMTGHQTKDAPPSADCSRFDRHSALYGADGQPVLRRGFDYITVWGYWNGPDELLAHRDGEYYKGINATQCGMYGMLSDEEVQEVLARERERLQKAGIQALNLKSDHLILSLDPKGVLHRDEEGNLEVRLCNFQFLKVQA